MAVIAQHCLELPAHGCCAAAMAMAVPVPPLRAGAVLCPVSARSGPALAADSHPPTLPADLLGLVLQRCEPEDGPAIAAAAPDLQRAWAGVRAGRLQLHAHVHGKPRRNPLPASLRHQLLAGLGSAPPPPRLDLRCWPSAPLGAVLLALQCVSQRGARARQVACALQGVRALRVRHVAGDSTAPGGPCPCPCPQCAPLGELAHPPQGHEGDAARVGRAVVRALPGLTTLHFDMAGCSHGRGLLALLAPLAAAGQPQRRQAAKRARVGAAARAGTVARPGAAEAEVQALAAGVRELVLERCPSTLAGGLAAITALAGLRRLRLDLPATCVNNVAFLAALPELGVLQLGGIATGLREVSGACVQLRELRVAGVLEPAPCAWASLELCDVQEAHAEDLANLLCRAEPAAQPMDCWPPAWHPRAQQAQARALRDVRVRHLCLHPAAATSGTGMSMGMSKGMHMPTDEQVAAGYVAAVQHVQRLVKQLGGVVARRGPAGVQLGVQAGVGPAVGPANGELEAVAASSLDCALRQLGGALPLECLLGLTVTHRTALLCCEAVAALEDAGVPVSVVPRLL